jgi:hypothetical protein
MIRTDLLFKALNGVRFNRKLRKLLDGMKQKMPEAEYLESVEQLENILHWMPDWKKEETVDLLLDIDKKFEGMV